VSVRYTTDARRVVGRPPVTAYSAGVPHLCRRLM